MDVWGHGLPATFSNSGMRFILVNTDVAETRFLNSKIFGLNLNKRLALISYWYTMYKGREHLSGDIRSLGKKIC